MDFFDLFGTSSLLNMTNSIPASFNEGLTQSKGTWWRSGCAKIMQRKMQNMAETQKLTKDL
jgi:hypothetical protein